MHGLRAGEGCGNRFQLAREAALRVEGIGPAEEAAFAAAACGAVHDGLHNLPDVVRNAR